LKDARYHKNDDIIIFSRFFDIDSQDKADLFLDEYKNNDLVKELILLYGQALADKQNLETIENSPYFTERLNEAQLAEAREEARKEAMEEARKEVKEEARKEEAVEIAKNLLIMGLIIEKIAQCTKLSEQFVRSLKEKEKSQR
jgi:predicted transposase/invertase (TIGR01784 family)